MGQTEKGASPELSFWTHIPSSSTRNPLFFFFNKFILFIYFWLHWVFIAACRLSLVAVSRGYSLLLAWASH